MQGLPYPPELASTWKPPCSCAMMLAQTEMLEDQAKMMDMQTMQCMPAGQVGAMPGVAPPAGEEGQDPSMGMGGAPPQGAPPEDGDPTGAAPPMASGPSGAPMSDPGDMSTGGVQSEPARNRTRPPESDEQRGNAPRAAAKTASERWARRIHARGRDDDEHRPPTKFEVGPSSVGHSRHVSEQEVEAAVQRRAMTAKHSTTPLVSQLVKDPNFYRMLNMGSYRGQIQADYPEIRAGGAEDSAKLLQEMIEQYEDITGVSPTWD